jgi:hypothetical protein
MAVPQNFNELAKFSGTDIAKARRGELWWFLYLIIQEVWRLGHGSEEKEAAPAGKP